MICVCPKNVSYETMSNQGKPRNGHTKKCHFIYFPNGQNKFSQFFVSFSISKLRPFLPLWNIFWVWIRQKLSKRTKTLKHSLLPQFIWCYFVRKYFLMISLIDYWLIIYWSFVQIEILMDRSILKITIYYSFYFVIE